MTTVSAAGDITASNAALHHFLHGLPGVDRVGADARVAMLSTRSIKAASKEMAIDLAISMVDLTTLEGMDTPGKVRALCAKFPDEYHRKVDAARAYPQEFVAALTSAGWLR